MKRRQNIDFEYCEFCEDGQLYCENDLIEGLFYDGDHVLCANCGIVGHMFADETAHVVFDDELMDVQKEVEK